MGSISHTPCFTFNLKPDSTLRIPYNTILYITRHPMDPGHFQHPPTTLNPIVGTHPRPNRAVKLEADVIPHEVEDICAVRGDTSNLSPQFRTELRSGFIAIKSEV